MILFLNKCDLLKRKLKSGVMVKDYLPSYGDRANDPSTVTKCLCSFLVLFLFLVVWPIYLETYKTPESHWVQWRVISLGTLSW